MTDANKKCTRCNEVKPVGEFSFTDQRSGQRHSWCKACAAKWVAEYRRTTPAGDDTRAYGAARRRALKQLIARHRDEYLALVHTELGRPLRKVGRKPKRVAT